MSAAPHANGLTNGSVPALEGLENVRIVDASAQSPSPANGVKEHQPQLTRGTTSGAATAIGGHSGSFQVKVRCRDALIFCAGL